jgi:Thioredoxin domain
VCPEMAVRIQIFMSPGCGHGQRTSELVEEVVRKQGPRADVETVLVTTREDAERFGFPGSPTVRVNGVDIEPGAPTSVGPG